MLNYSSGGCGSLTAIPESYVSIIIFVPCQDPGSAAGLWYMETSLMTHSTLTMLPDTLHSTLTVLLDTHWMHPYHLLAAPWGAIFKHATEHL